MREIKFRAWDKHKKVFIPTEVWAVVTTDFNAFGVMLKDWENYKEGEYFYSNSQGLSQFTGLHDRNGREIYEGDVNQDGGILVWHKDSCSFCWDYANIELMAIDGSEPEWCVVIGNIYENPELLNQ